jgi:nucleoside-diphosphate-sugar epimerase
MARGHTVRALVRSTSRRSGFRRSPEWVEGDIEDEAAVAALLDDVQGVVHCAFSHVPGRYRGGEGDDVRGFWRTNFGASVRLLRLARSAGVHRVVLMSSRAVFAGRGPGEDPTQPVADAYPPRPDTQYGMLKLAEEQLAAASEGMAACALRPTGVYGMSYPAARSKWFGLVGEVLAGKTVTASRTATEVHGVDVARAVEILLSVPAVQVRGLAFNCSDITLSTRELVQRVAQLADVSATLPPPSPPVANPMSCGRLHALGWRPGGEERLQATLLELIAAVSAQGSARRNDGK